MARLSGGSEEAVKAELGKLEFETWDSNVQRAAQAMMQREMGPDGQQLVKPVTQRRTFWVKASKWWPLHAAAARKLMSVHATTAAAERNWSVWGHHYTKIRNQLSLETAKMMISVKANADLGSTGAEGMEVELALDHMA